MGNILGLTNLNVGNRDLPAEISYHSQEKVWKMKTDKPEPVNLTEKHLVLLRVSKVDTNPARTGDFGIQLAGVIESIGHIRSKRPKPKEIEEAEKQALEE